MILSDINLQYCNITRYRVFHILLYVNLLFLLVFSSCYSPRYVYSPSTQNIPEVRKKGDINLGGYFATGGGNARSSYAGSPGYNLGMDLHSSYALSDHFAILLNKYNRWEKSNGSNDFNLGDSAIIKYERGLTELAAGYFAPLRKDVKNTFFQVFGGVAFGKFHIQDNGVNNGISSGRFHHTHITKIFIQPGIIIGQPQNSTASFSSRLSEVFYHRINTNYTKEELDNYLLNDLSSSPVFFWEPAINYSLAFKKIKGTRISLQGGLAILLNRRFVDYRTINFSLGIVANNDLFKGIKKSSQKPESTKK